MSIRRGKCGVFITVALISGLASPLLAGCTQSETRDRPGLVAATGAPVIVPGGPGEAGRTAKPGERVGASSSAPSAADVLFTQRMIPHHRQALEMAGLAASRTANKDVLRLCERISVGQLPEIGVMSRWLRALGREVPEEHRGHTAATGMDGYGMASLEEMNRLRAARGAAFDTLLLRLMIRHHEGAVKMAGEELSGGTDQTMRKMAHDMGSGQQVEIGRMRKLLG